MSGLPAGWAWATLAEVSTSVRQDGPQTDEFIYVDIGSVDAAKKEIASAKRLAATGLRPEPARTFDRAMCLFR